jgi:short subunit dehydrogenase-like uncharacterized protein
MPAAREFDYVIFGVTGFTGQYVAQTLAAQGGKGLKWAAAGRSEKKVRDTLVKFGLEATPIIVADTKDQASMDAMAARAAVCINCVGPFRFHGEPVVKACVTSGTQYCDITGEPLSLSLSLCLPSTNTEIGEPEFIEGSVLKYHEEAAKTGARVVHACGFDSIPADIGTLFVREEFDKVHGGGDVVPAIESYLR